MRKSLLYALLLICASIIILLLNKGTTSVDLLFVTVSGLKSVVFLAFVVIGVTIGLLLK
jgi:uncharacterized integral membrane protein